MTSSALELLEKHPSTIILRRFGLTDDHLNAIKFSPKYRHLRFDQWPLTWHPTVPVESCPTILSHMRIFASYRFALIDGASEGFNGISEAFSYVGDNFTAGLVENRLEYLGLQ
jgi:hypothetical protein